ncbi:MAG: serine acetyltransferase, partial [Polyangiales bacterium]
MSARRFGLVTDAVELARVSDGGDVSLRSIVRTALLLDSFSILVTTRARELARRLHVPGVNHALRLFQTLLYGIEIGRDVQLGRGIYFVHTVGTVIGGNAKVGDRV